MSVDLKESAVPLAEISQGPNAFEAFLDRNQKGIAIFAVLLALGAIAAVIYRGIEKSHQETAGAALTKASDIASYQAVVANQTGTTAAESALVLLANSQWDGGKQDDAIATLRKFIAESPNHPAIPSAKANLASKLQAQGKSGDATKLFEELVSDPEARFITPFALIALGDIARSAGDLEKAEASYNKVKTEFSDSSFVQTASLRSISLKAKPPTEIEPPPAPAPAPAPDASTSLVPTPGTAPAPVELTPASPAPTTPEKP